MKDFFQPDRMLYGVMNVLVGQCRPYLMAVFQCSADHIERGNHHLGTPRFVIGFPFQTSCLLLDFFICAEIFFNILEWYGFPVLVVGERSAPDDIIIGDVWQKYGPLNQWLHF